MIFTVPPSLASERIDRVVSFAASCTRAESAELIGEGAVQCNGVAVSNRSRRVAEGDVIDVTLREPTATTSLAGDGSVPFSVVYADEQVIVVDKPAGVVVHPGAGNPSGTLVHGLLHRFPDLALIQAADAAASLRPGIVHRLDKGTSGLLMVGRTSASVEALIGQLGDRSVSRRYLALAWGRFAASTGLIDARVGRSSGDPTKMTVTATGRAARTRYAVERYFVEPEPVTLARCWLETGRTHQIRVHLAAIGHPVVGDARYGGAKGSIRVPRPFLHAASLSFAHPTTGEQLSFDSPLPADLQLVLDSLVPG